MASFLSFALALLPLLAVFATPGVAQQLTKEQGDLFEATAVGTETGVLLQWHTSFEKDNLGFNVYRLSGGQRTRVNREIIPGSIFTNEAISLRAGNSYSWLDASGSTDSTYYIESVSLTGVSRVRGSLKVAGVVGNRLSGANRAGAVGELPGEGNEGDQFEKQYPAAEAPQIISSETIEEQWFVAGQTGLKISVKKDGWYRVTQPQMAAVGFNPPDIGNLRLFVNGQELGIRTSQSRGPLSVNDYFEFYGQGLDTLTTDTRTYYLIAGTQLGRRAGGGGDLQTDSSPPTSPPPAGLPPAIPSAPPRSTWFGWIWRVLTPTEESREAPDNVQPIKSEPARAEPVETASQVQPFTTEPTKTEPVKTEAVNAESIKSKPDVAPKKLMESDVARPAATGSSAQSSSQAAVKPKRKTARKKRRPVQRRQRRENSHAQNVVAAAPTNFSFTVEKKDRLIYFANVLNGDKDNFFGSVIANSSTNQVINLPNPDLAATGTAQLEVALQGVNQVSHSVTVQLNGAPVGSVNYFGMGNPVQIFSVPISQLLSGNNTVTLSSGAGDANLIDYLRITYPHTFQADNDSLRFSLPGRQSVKVGGFTSSSVRLIDYTDPFAVKISRPAVEPSGGGFAITVPTLPDRQKPTRLLFAVADSQVATAPALTLNQASSLNLNNNAAEYLVVAHKDFIPHLAPLTTLRQNQGLSTKVVDVEDIYDEFGYGEHGPQAVKAFLSHAATSWATKPRYVVFAGDSSLDPRNFTANPGGSFDFVPTKLVDATFNETSSDDWLTDFDDDGIGNIPMGRLAVRTTAEINLLVSKIVNFSPANVPQNAILVADDHTNPPYFFNFEEANDQVAAMLPGIGIEKVYRRIDSTSAWTINCQNQGNPDCSVKAHIKAKFNEGQAVANYSGHGNVDTWAGGSFSANDAFALTNGNKLSFVIVMDCLNGYFHDPILQSMAEQFMKAPAGGSVATFASSGLTIPEGQHDMSEQLYTLIYAAGAPPIALGDAIKIAKGSTTDIDVRRTWIFFGDPAMKIK